MSIFWRGVTATAPRECRVVLAYRSGDLYPVIASRTCYGDHDERWTLEEGGPEDGEDRKFPVAGDAGWQPDWWAPIPELPDATFNILEDGDLFCRGIVVDLRDLAPEEAERASAEKNLGELRKYNAQWHAQADKHFGKYLEWRARAEKAEAKVAELQEAWNLDFKAELRNTEHINILEAEVAKLRELLAYIGDEESGWRFRVDPLEHAHSVIEQMRERARAALDPEPGGDGREDGMSDRDPIKAALAVCEATEAKNWYERELLVQLLVGETVTLDQDALFIETFSPATVAAMLKALELAREALERDDDTYNGRAEDSEAWQHHRQMLREAALAAIDALPMPGTEVSDE